MLSFFKKKEKVETKKKFDYSKSQNLETAKLKSTAYGREITTIKTAQIYNTKPERVDPYPLLVSSSNLQKNYYGQNMQNEPVSLWSEDILHTAVLGSSGTGKGIYTTCYAVQRVVEKKGVVVFDPKGDVFMAGALREELIRQGRKEDFLVVNFPQDFGYIPFLDEDEPVELADKIIKMLGIEPSGEAGVDYYRKNEREILSRLISIFYISGELGIIEKKFETFVENVKKLRKDLKNKMNYEKEVSKTNPNAKLLKKFQNLYFKMEILDELDFVDTDVQTIESLAISLQEVTNNINFTNRINIKQALYENKVIYFKMDMLSEASNKWCKFIVADLISRTKKKKANTLIICDEASTYVSKELAIALAVVRSGGLEFVVIFQTIEQIPKDLRAPILDNCNCRIQYKTNNLETLNELAVLGGKETVSKFSTRDGIESMSQDTEDFLNNTKIRAFRKAQQAVLIAECLTHPIVIHTNFIAVQNPYNFEDKIIPTSQKVKTFEEIQKSKKDKLARYKIILKDSSKKIDNSDLLGYELESVLL